MSRDRVLAVLLLLIAFITLAASKAFPFMRDIPEPAKIAVVAIGAVCALAGVGLWLRKAPEQP
jgi:ABC-type Mn2+/Zn2+ transport system permease subunit